MQSNDVFVLGSGLTLPWELTKQQLDMFQTFHGFHFCVIADQNGLLLWSSSTSSSRPLFQEVYIAAIQLISASLRYHTTSGGNKLGDYV